MAWIRLSDDYNDHPKFDNLSDGAFRLWHQAMGFCRKYQTDGLIPLASVRQFKAYSLKRMKELLGPWRAGENPLWHVETGFGVKVHDYLQWNPSKDEENERRTDSRDRMRSARERRLASGVAPVAPVVRANTLQTARHVPGRESNTKAFKEEEIDERDALDLRAGEFLNRYAELFYEHRKGARYHSRPALDYPKACDLVRTWPDSGRLEKLAVLVLTTDDDWIARTDRGFAVFAARATWADERLAAWESEHGVHA